LLFSDVMSYNHQGTMNLPLLMTGVTVNSLKRTFATILILAVCMGFGVVKKLSVPIFVALGVYGITYYLFSETSEIIDYLREKTLLPVDTTLVFLGSFVPVILLDFIFFVWVFLAIFKTMKKLESPHHVVKFHMYKSLRITLMVALVVSFLAVVTELIVLGFFADGTWTIWWIWDSYWETLYFGVLVAIAVIWRPNQNNQRYAYQPLSTGEEFDLELDVLAGDTDEDQPSSQLSPQEESLTNGNASHIHDDVSDDDVHHP